MRSSHFVPFLHVAIEQPEQVPKVSMQDVSQPRPFFETQAVCNILVQDDSAGCFPVVRYTILFRIALLTTWNLLKPHQCPCFNAGWTLAKNAVEGCDDARNPVSVFIPGLLQNVHDFLGGLSFRVVQNTYKRETEPCEFASLNDLHDSLRHTSLGTFIPNVFCKLQNFPTILIFFVQILAACIADNRVAFCAHYRVYSA